MPDPSPVVTEHENETATEKAARLALDQANISRLGAVLQLHCGLMHYAALFVVKPDQKGLQDEWVAWLQKAAQIYPHLTCRLAGWQAAIKPPPPKIKKKGRGAVKPPALPRFNPSDLKGKALRDSIISQVPRFQALGGQGAGSVGRRRILPKLYRANVLEPLRVTPNHRDAGRLGCLYRHGQRR